MPIFVRTDIYEPVCDFLLENSGLNTLDIISEDDFIRFSNETISDFLTYSQCKKKILCQEALAFQSEYTQPNEMLRSQDVLYNGNNLYHSYVFYTDSATPNFANDPAGVPNEWFIEDSAVKNIRFNPTPGYNGDAAAILLGDGLYGTVSSTSDVLDYDITCDPLYPDGLLGTASTFSQGGAYVEATAPMFGTIANIVATAGFNGNFALIGHVGTFNPITELDQYVELINPSYDLYLQFGILARIFSGDSEYKDETREKYCVMRFLEGLNVARAMMNLEPLTGLPNRRR